MKARRIIEDGEYLFCLARFYLAQAAMAEITQPFHPPCPLATGMVGQLVT